MLRRDTDNKIPLSITKLSDHSDNSQIFIRSNKKRGLGKRSAIENEFSAVTNQRLEAFISYFVKEFETRLIAYCMIVEEKIKKTEEIWQALRLRSTTTCEFEKLFLLKEKDDVNNPKNILYSSNLDMHAKYKIVTFRQRLVEAGIDIFQSFEMQFMRVTSGQGNDGPVRAMHKLAKDAVDRAMNYIQKNGGILIENGNVLIAESVLFGQSKEKVISTEASQVSEQTRTFGFKVNYEYQANKVEWRTASLFKKTGLVRESTNSFSPPTYYKSKNNQSDTSKYGYRRLFALESLYNLGEGYEEDSVDDNKRQFTNYTYLINPKELKERSLTLLKGLNHHYIKLSDARIKSLFKEAKQAILKEISALKKQCYDHVAYCNLLENSAAGLNNSNVDDYLSKFDSYFEEMQKNQINTLKKALLIKDNDGKTALHIATFGMESQQSVKELLWQVKDQPDFVKELLRVQDNKGRTPLHMAAWWGRPQAVSELLEPIKTQSNFLQALLLLQDENGRTPLHVAARKDQELIIDLLLDGVKDQPAFLKKLFSMQDENGATPLHVAAQYRSMAGVEILLKKGANVNAEDKEGKTPLILAEQNGYVEVANLLRKHTGGSILSSQKAARSVRAILPHELKRLDIHQPSLEKDEQISLSQKELISKQSISYSMDRCTLGIRYGHSYVEGITCDTKNMKMMIFIKDSHIKLDRPEDIYFRERCRPIEFNGRPSVYCEGQKTNIVYTPEISQQHSLEQLNDQLMLFYVLLHEGKKLYSWLHDFFKKKNNSVVSLNKPHVVCITTQQKAVWEKSLVSIEIRLKDLNDISKGKGKLSWAKYILEDRKQEFEDLLRRPQASLEEVNTFTENLQALQTELEIMESPTLTASSSNKGSSAQKMEEIDMTKQHPLSSIFALSVQKGTIQYSARARLAVGSDRGFFKAPQRLVSTFIPVISATNTSSYQC